MPDRLDLALTIINDFLSVVDLIDGYHQLALVPSELVDVENVDGVRQYNVEVYDAELFTGFANIGVTVEHSHEPDTRLEPGDSFTRIYVWVDDLIIMQPGVVYGSYSNAAHCIGMFVGDGEDRPFLQRTSWHFFNNPTDFTEELPL